MSSGELVGPLGEPENPCVPIAFTRIRGPGPRDEAPLWTYSVYRCGCAALFCDHRKMWVFPAGRISSCGVVLTPIGMTAPDAVDPTDTMHTTTAASIPRRTAGIGPAMALPRSLVSAAVLPYARRHGRAAELRGARCPPRRRAPRRG